MYRITVEEITVLNKPEDEYPRTRRVEIYSQMVPCIGIVRVIEAVNSLAKEREEQDDLA